MILLNSAPIIEIGILSPQVSQPQGTICYGCARPLALWKTRLAGLHSPVVRLNDCIFTRGHPWPLESRIRQLAVIRIEGRSNRPNLGHFPVAPQGLPFICFTAIAVTGLHSWSFWCPSVLSLESRNPLQENCKEQKNSHFVASICEDSNLWAKISNPGFYLSAICQCYSNGE